jgi:hypothetical protein
VLKSERRVGKSYLPTRTKNNGGQFAHPTILRFWHFAFLSPVRRRVAQAGQGLICFLSFMFRYGLRPTDETTSHSTKLPNNSSQVAGYQHERP